jgi:hypothetical protein
MLSEALLIIAAVSFAAAVVIFVDLAVGNLSIPRLELQERAIGELPRVSVIVAARNEELEIRGALQSVLMQDYPNYEVLVVEDRSTDSTGAILEQIAAEYPRLHVEHVTGLPDGWLGKNHALYTGANRATGEMLLFTDADVNFALSTISRAVGFMQREHADHITVAPHLEPGTIPLSLAVQYFILWFTVYMRPWRARNPKSRYFVGIGAFNLVRRSAYERAGTLLRIPLRPDDDIMLGKILKQSGASQHVLTGQGMLTVKWYSTLPEMIAGFRKNAFAGLKYSVLLVIGAVIANLVFNVWPFVALFVTHGITRTLNTGIALLLISMYAGGAAIQRNRPWLAIFYPVAALIFIYMIVVTTGRTLLRRGIEWRGTHYSLDQLKSNKV